MITSLSAYTFEIDDPEAAVAEIREQIDVQSLGSHSLGILTCSTEFLETGTARAVSEAMPFDVIGCTTAGTAVAGELGEMMLGLTVLTGDDVDFAVAVTESLTEEQDAPIEAAYRKAAEKRAEKPAMVLAFAPYSFKVGGEKIMESLSHAAGGLPIFGTLAIDITADLNLNATFFNGVSNRTALSFALIYGDIHPSFFMASILEEKIQKQRGVITKSKGNILMEVNNIPLENYLESLGLSKDKAAFEIAAFPFVVDYNDGTRPVARSIYNFTEEGYAACGGFVPENATIALGGADYYDVLRTTSEIMDKINAEKNGSCLLMFGCLSRFLVLGANTTAEMEKIREAAGSERRYQFCYSGGEICPVYTESGQLINRFHNCSLIACLL